MNTATFDNTVIKPWAWRSINSLKSILQERPDLHKALETSIKKVGATSSNDDGKEYFRFLEKIKLIPKEPPDG